MAPEAEQFTAHQRESKKGQNTCVKTHVYGRGQQATVGDMTLHTRPRPGEQRPCPHCRMWQPEKRQEHYRVDKDGWRAHIDWKAGCIWWTFTRIGGYRDLPQHIRFGGKDLRQHMERHCPISLPFTGRSTFGTGRLWAHSWLRPCMIWSHPTEAESHAGTCLAGCQPLGLCDPAQYTAWVLGHFHSLALRWARAREVLQT